MKKHICTSIVILQLLILAGCAPHYIVPKSNSYSANEFTKFSQNYGKTLYTKNEKGVHFDEMTVKGDSVYVSKDGGSTKAVALSNVVMINLSPRVSATFWGAFAGLGVGVGTAALIASGSNKFGSAITYAILPPVFGAAGGLIGEGINKRNAYAGNYRVITDGNSYRVKPMRPKK